ncbi:MAG: glycosyltransferase family 4 protein [Verrucomicrobia bacterium]|nr:glycosyltransferase family 4 protein [Verrucomicrobiota bacterium]
MTHEFAPFRGGVATYVEQCVHAARRLGYDARVVTVDYRGRRELPPPEQDMPVLRLPASGRLSPAGILALARGFFGLRKTFADAPVVPISVGAHLALVLLAASGAGSPRRVLNFFHGSDILRLIRRPWPAWAAFPFYRRHPHFAVASSYVRTLLAGSGLAPHPETALLAPCACAPTLLQRATDMALANAPVKNDGRLRVLTVARIHPRKGQLELARALANLPENLRRRLIYQLVGEGDDAYLRSVQTYCQGAGVACEHLGAVADDELPAIYRACTLFAMTSRSLPQSVEGFGIAYLEAAAFSRPVIAFRSGGTAEAVRDGETGLLVAENDLPALTAALTTLLSNEALRARLGAAGQAFARTFSWEKSARVLCDAALALTAS